MGALPQHTEARAVLDDWRTPPAALELGAAEVHLWRIGLAPAAAAEIERAYVLLDGDERRRAARFASAPLRRRFVVSHAALRDVLARYLGSAPGALELVHGEHGQPGLAPRAHPRDATGLRFSLSHAVDLALVAVGRVEAVGVDLEPVDRTLDLELLARRCLSAAELAELRGLPEPMRADGFLRAWTRKEAFWKARGEGLSRALTALTVSLSPGKPARLLRLEGDLEDLARWSLTHLDPAPGYLGAVAVSEPHPVLRRWRWEGLTP